MTTTCALMGATGATGSAILRHLLAQPRQDMKLNIYVRNKAKLLRAFPDLETNATFPIHIYEGSNTDVSLLRQCLRDVQVVYLCIAVNVAKKGDDLFTATAAAIVSGLQELRQEQQAYQTPSIIILRAFPLNAKLGGASKGMGESVLWYALEHVYGNMIEANELYEAKARESPGLLECIYVDPPAIHDEAGTHPTGYELVLEAREGISHVVSYADLGVAFCEIADRRREFAGQGIGVVSTGKVNLTWSSNFGQLLLNFRARWLGW